jgi:hypothetical protein
MRTSLRCILGSIILPSVLERVQSRILQHLPSVGCRRSPREEGGGEWCRWGGANLKFSAMKWRAGGQWLVAGNREAHQAYFCVCRRIFRILLLNL